eukprot:PITA_31943
MFAPVPRYTTIHLIIALAASQRWNLHQMDVKTAFLHGSIKEEVYVEQPGGFEIHCWESHVCSVVDRKSTSECCFSLGSTSISWMSRKQKSVALSTAEAKYIAASMASCEAVWLWKLFSELFGFTLGTTVILCDNQSGIRLLENPVFHDRSKHIDIKYHYISDMVQQGAIRLQHIGTDDQVADILTKPLGKVKFLTF